MQEAGKLSALSDEMQANGYSLHAVLHEELGWEEFADLFKPNPVYIDIEVNKQVSLQLQNQLPAIES